MKMKEVKELEVKELEEKKNDGRVKKFFVEGRIL